MGQYWMVVNVCKRQHIFMGKLPEMIFCLRLDQYFSPSFDLLSADRRPRQSDPSEPECPNPYHPQTQSAFMQLPVELIHAISAHLGSFEDAVCLALTCKMSWDTGLYTLARLQFTGGSWAGDRIICVGDNAFDFPDGLSFDDAERTIIGKYAQRPYASLAKLCPTEVPHNLVEDFFDTLRDIGQDDYDVWVNRVPNPRRRRIPEGIVLRNLVTREYVRGNAFRERLATAPADSYIHEWSLVDVLVPRICCPTAAVGAMDYNKFSDAWLSLQSCRCIISVELCGRTSVEQQSKQRTHQGVVTRSKLVLQKRVEGCAVYCTINA